MLPQARDATSQEGASSAFQSGSGGGSPCLPENPTWTTYNANNQINGGPIVPSYDAAGDITLDTNPNGTHQYLYDAEGRVCAVEGAAADGINVMTGYVYDAAGQRVAKGAITSWSCDPSSNGFSAAVNETDYILDQSGHQITEMASDPSGNMAWMHTNVWADGQLIGTYDADGLHFYQNDWLGTRRAQTDFAGVQQQTCTSLPFGDGLNCSGAGQYAPSLQYPTEHHFTGKERDAESGNDYFGARYYASSVGRFMSPDWSAKEEPVPYAKTDDPQTLNLYSYVRNNPLSRMDADGHCFEDACVLETAGAPTIGVIATVQAINTMQHTPSGSFSDFTSSGCQRLQVGCIIRRPRDQVDIQQTSCAWKQARPGFYEGWEENH